MKRNIYLLIVAILFTSVLFTNNLVKAASDDDSYRAAYLATHNEDGSIKMDTVGSYSWNYLYDSTSNSYNYIATSTAGKVVGNHISYYDTNPTTGSFERTTDASINTTGKILLTDGNGTEVSGTEGWDYPVVGAVYDLSGKMTHIKVNVLVNDSNRGGTAIREGLIPVGEAEVNGELPPPTPPVEAPLGGSRGHISMSQSYQTYTNIPPSTEINVWSDKYDISQGIPTSEYLKIEGTAPKALYHIVVRITTIKAWNDPVDIKAWAEYESTCHHDTWNRKDKEWDCTSACHDEITSTTQTCYSGFEASVQKTFYDVTVSRIYSLQSVTVTETNETYSTYVLNKTMSMDGISGPGADTLYFHLRAPNISSSYTRDYEGYHGRSYSSAASAARGSSGSAGKAAVISELNSAVNNSVSGSVNYSWQGLRVTKTSKSGSPNLGYSTATGEILIPSSYPNGRYIPDGYFTYAGYGNVSKIPNQVYVHTPVANNAKITGTSIYVNQKVNIDASKSNYYLMLDEEFTITIPDTGIHRNIKGYSSGNTKKAYNSKQGSNGKSDTTWGVLEEAKFPFDIYVNGKSGRKYFVPAGEWMSAQSWWNSALSDITTWSSSVGTQYTFTIPVWVKEQRYIKDLGNPIEVRVVAENAFGDRNIDGINHLDETMQKQEHTANTDITKYVATQYIDCEVIGKIYDLRINASNDPGWADVYSYKTKKDYITATEFPFGQQGHNRVTQYKYAPKLGYTFAFNFKTKGRKSNNVDVSIQPEGFYFIGKNGGNLQEVDLYYNSTTSKNIKIDANKPTGSIAVRLTDKFMEVPTQEIVDSNRIYPQPTEIGKVYNYNLSVAIGSFAKMNLPHALRLCYNNFIEYSKKLYGTNNDEAIISVNAGTRDNVIGSVGHWHAGYRLPATTMAVPAGKDINEAIRTNTLLKDGYIIVKFDIVTKSPTNNTEDPKAGEPGNNYLRYPGPEALNESGEDTGVTNTNLAWPSEKQNSVKTQPARLPNGVTAQVPTGSVAIFEANIRSSNDAEVGGTH